MVSRFGSAGQRRRGRPSPRTRRADEIAGKQFRKGLIDADSVEDAAAMVRGPDPGSGAWRLSRVRASVYWLCWNVRYERVAAVQGRLREVAGQVD